MTRTFNCLDREESGKAPSKEIRNRGGERIEAMEDNQQDDTADEGVSLGHLRALFESRQKRILGELRDEVSCERHDVYTPLPAGQNLYTYLLVKLTNIVVCFVLSLLESRMLLNFLRSGHLSNRRVRQRWILESPIGRRRNV